MENRRDHPGGRAVGAHGRIKADVRNGADHDDTEGDRHDPAGGDLADRRRDRVSGRCAGVIFHTVVRSVSEKTSGMRHRRCTGSICMGLRHIQKKADRVLSFPADVPMITADTIEKMAQAPGSMAVPVCQGKKGHPVMLSKEVFATYLNVPGRKRTSRRNGCVGRRCPGDRG